MPTRRRRRVTSCFRISSPSRSISPVSRVSLSVSCMRFSVRSRVDFPQPDGPISAVTWFVAISQIDVEKRLRFSVIKIQIGNRHPHRQIRRRLFDASPGDAVTSFSAGRKPPCKRGLCGGSENSITFYLACCVPRLQQQPRKQIGNQHQLREHKPGSPGLPVPIIVRRKGVVVNHHWQRGGGLIPSVAPKLISKSGEDQRRGFAGDARKRKQNRRQEYRWMRRESRPSRSFSICWRRRPSHLRATTGATLRRNSSQLRKNNRNHHHAQRESAGQR